jgi:hypothetical protein
LGHQSAFDRAAATVLVRALPEKGHFVSVDMVCSSAFGVTAEV